MKIDLDQIVMELKEIVDTNPGFIYPKGGQDCEMCWDFPLGQDFELEDCGLHTSSDGGCRYFDNSNYPVCIMGRWLESHNLKTPSDFGVDCILEIEDEKFDDVVGMTDYELTEDAIKFGLQIQSNQDHYYTWLDSFNRSLDKMKEGNE